VGDKYRLLVSIGKFQIPGINIQNSGAENP